MKKLLLLFLVLFIQTIFAQNIEEIEKEVHTNNKRQKFEASISLITEHLDNTEINSYDVYKLYILKSHTYKSLFNYDKTLENLDIALKEGLKSNKKEEVIANVKAEKAFAYFDIQKYKEAATLMEELKNSNYNHLELETTAYIIMQDGYLDFLNKNYSSSEVKYDKAISFMKKVAPQNLPVIYGKKILLYSKTKDTKKALNSFNAGLQFAKKPKNLKYILYLNESLRTFYEESNQWQLAVKTFHRVDSLRTVYNAEEESNKVNLLEKDIIIERKNNELNTNKIIRNSLLVACLLLTAVGYLIYRLLKTNKEKASLLEKENDRIFNELQILTNSLDNSGIRKFDINKYNLSDRQLEIVELLIKGKSNKEIAELVCISENTVKYHLKAIYDELKIDNRSEFFKFIRNN